MICFVFLIKIKTEQNNTDSIMKNWHIVPKSDNSAPKSILMIKASVCSSYTNLEAGSVRDIKLVSDGEERSSFSLRLEELKIIF
jgi:hypothetical protein